MNVTVKGRGIEVTPAMRDYAQKKLTKLSEYDSELRTAEVTVKTEGPSHKVEVTLHGDGVLLRAEEHRPDFYEAVDCVLEKLEHQVKKHHKRCIERNRHHSAREVPDDFVARDLNSYDPPAGLDANGGSNDAFQASVNGSHPRIERVKRFDMKPMSAEEATIQMDMVGHKFFVFRNARGGEVNVVYHRTDGTYGLIEAGDEG